MVSLPWEGGLSLSPYECQVEHPTEVANMFCLQTTGSWHYTYHDLPLLTMPVNQVMVNAVVKRTPFMGMSVFSQGLCNCKTKTQLWKPYQI